MLKKNKLLLIFPVFLFIVSFIITSPIVSAQTVCYCYCNTGQDNYKYTSTVNTESECYGDNQAVCGSASGYCGPKPTTTTTGNNNSGGVSIRDPLGLGASADNIEKVIARIVTTLLGLVGVASLVAFVYAGFIFIFSAGNAERVKKAKETMLYAVIGVAVAMASYAILSWIFKTLETATGQ